MRGLPGTLALLCAAALLGAPVAAAQAPVAGVEAAPTRDEYRLRVEKICKRDSERGKKILRGARGRINNGKLAAAGRQFLRVSRAFGGAVRQIVKVSRPPNDDVRLRKWHKFLRILRTRLREVGQTLLGGNRIKVNHATIRAERTGNAANNVSFPFEFRYCRFTRSRFG
jgi:hypothetical protein